MRGGIHAAKRLEISAHPRRGLDRPRLGARVFDRARQAFEPIGRLELGPPR